MREKLGGVFSKSVLSSFSFVPNPQIVTAETYYVMISSFKSGLALESGLQQVRVERDGASAWRLAPSRAKKAESLFTKSRENGV